MSTTTEELSGGNRLKLLKGDELSGVGKQFHDALKQIQNGRYDPRYITHDSSSKACIHQ